MTETPDTRLDDLYEWWLAAEVASVAYRGDELISIGRKPRSYVVSLVTEDRVKLEDRDRVLNRYQSPEDAEEINKLIALLRSIAYATPEDLGRELFRAGVRVGMPTNEELGGEEPLEGESNA